MADELQQQAEEYASRRGGEARALLENPLFVEAFQNLEDIWAHALRTAPVDRPDALVRARLCLEVLDMVKREVASIATTGKMTDQAVQDRQEQERWLAAERAENG